jgi:hypothetical protein
VLQESCWGNRPSVMHLALQYGASIHAVPFQDVIETWNRDVVQLFLSRGAANPPGDAITVIATTRGSPPWARHSFRHEQVDGNRGRDTRDGSVAQPASGLKP